MDDSLMYGVAMQSNVNVKWLHLNRKLQTAPAVVYFFTKIIF